MSVLDGDSPLGIDAVVSSNALTLASRALPGVVLDHL